MVATSPSDSQIEALLARSECSDPDLQAVADLLAAVRGLVRSEAEADFSGLYAAAAREAGLTPIERSAAGHDPGTITGSAADDTRGPGWRQLTRRWVLPRR